MGEMQGRLGKCGISLGRRRIRRKRGGENCPQGKLGRDRLGWRGKGEWKPPQRQREFLSISHHGKGEKIKREVPKGAPNEKQGRIRQKNTQIFTDHVRDPPEADRNKEERFIKSRRQNKLRVIREEGGGGATKPPKPPHTQETTPL